MCKGELKKNVSILLELKETLEIERIYVYFILKVLKYEISNYI